VKRKVMQNSKDEKRNHGEESPQWKEEFHANITAKKFPERGLLRISDI
jgi:hypothetical protein